jgi:hypothetical protein
MSREMADCGVMAVVGAVDRATGNRRTG